MNPFLQELYPNYLNGNYSLSSPWALNKYSSDTPKLLARCAGFLWIVSPCFGQTSTYIYILT